MNLAPLESDVLNTSSQHIILPTAYFGPIQYYKVLNSGSDVWIEQYENYQKQSLRTRCEIATSQGKQTLSIPVEGSHGQKCQIKDVRISDHGNWRHLHWNALVTAYHESPFFEYYEDDLRQFFEKKWTFLLDFNNEINAKICELTDINPSAHLTEKYEGVTLLQEPDEVKTYYQVYQQKTGFIPNLSILDLLFNMGNESIFYL